MISPMHWPAQRTWWKKGDAMDSYPRWKLALDALVLVAAGVVYALAYYFSILPE